MSNFSLCVILILTSYFLFVFPLIFYQVINPRLKKKLNMKKDSNINFITSFPVNPFVKKYYWVPAEVSRYIGYKFILKILGCKANKIKIGNSTLQNLNYTSDHFSFLEISYSLINLLLGYLWLGYCIYFVILKH